MNHDKEHRSLKSFFATKETVQDIREKEQDDYTVAHNRHVDMVFRIVAVLCAIGIWIFTIISDSATKEFTNFKVLMKGASIVTQRTYTVHYDETFVNFEIQGTASQISQISDSDIQVYVDISSVNLSAITGSQSFDLPLIYEIVSNKSKDVIFVQKSQEKINVVITKNPTNGS